MILAVTCRVAVLASGAESVNVNTGRGLNNPIPKPNTFIDIFMEASIANVSIGYVVCGNRRNIPPVPLIVTRMFVAFSVPMFFTTVDIPFPPLNDSKVRIGAFSAAVSALMQKLAVPSQLGSAKS